MAHCRLALVQLNAGTDKEANVDRAVRLIREASAAGAQLVALPETFHLRVPASQNHVKIETAEPIPGPLTDRLGALAAEHGIWLLAGSFSEKSDVDDKVYNTSLLFAGDGSIRASYRKIHLFDVSIAGQFHAQESARNLPGDKVVVADTAFGRVGLSVCYDLRFPELYRSLALKGASIAFVPANFTLFTGKDHWEPLLRARAIENGMFMVAPAQIGGVEGAFQAYGRSMVVDPWGTVVACAPDEEGITLVDIDLDAVARTRQRMPSLSHRRPDTYEMA
ncbi:MAG TPA: carbon-nitrogen hydrolase family protein [Trueperaceae bacterium]|nr:carbon-nitrogen hydrolase family protein [Trueperaceae bacterium]